MVVPVPFFNTFEAKPEAVLMASSGAAFTMIVRVDIKTS